VKRKTNILSFSLFTSQKSSQIAAAEKRRNAIGLTSPSTSLIRHAAGGKPGCTVTTFVSRVVARSPVFQRARSQASTIATKNHFLFFAFVP
jgi:hypothetical protein